MERTKAVRRRGAALEHALLEAAWAELTEKGYGHFTMDAVADRAQTSRPVLYRRWPQRWDLVVAAVRHHHEQNPLTVPDTGSLREDLFSYLREVSDKRVEFAALFSLHLAQFFEETKSTPGEFRRQVIQGRMTGVGVDALWDRAVARGEAHAVALTPRVRALAFDLLRNELARTLRPVPEETIIEIVDQIVLPLVRPR
jgi:AcrR family transcriptional regulator